MRSLTQENTTNTNFKPDPVAPLIYKLTDQQIDDTKSSGNGSSSTQQQTTYLKSIPHTSESKHIYDMLSHPFIYCFITPNAIIGNKTEYKFKFNLYIQNPDDHSQDKSVYRYIFSTSFKDIKALYSKAVTKRKYFPVQKFPTC